MQEAGHAPYIRSARSRDIPELNISWCQSNKIIHEIYRRHHKRKVYLCLSSTYTATQHHTTQEEMIMEAFEYLPVAIAIVAVVARITLFLPRQRNTPGRAA